MRVQDVAKLSTRMFKTNPSRTWLTILGMGVGIGAVVTLVGLGFGLQNIILNQIVFGETLLSLGVTAPPGNVIKLDPTSVNDLRALPNVKDVAPLASYPALITFNGLTGNVFLQGADPAYFRYTGAREVAGTLFKEGRGAADNASSVLLSKAVLKLFEVEDPASVIGQTVTFRVFVSKPGSEESEEVALDKQYRIIGVTNEENFISGILTLAEFSSHFTVPSYEKVQVRAESSEVLPEVQAAIVAKGFIVAALSKTVDQANKIFVGIQAVLAVFGSIALTVSAIGMFNTMTVTLLERTSEIGIMRTLGASSNDIKILFVAEAVIVGFLGGVVGILIGVGIGFTLNTAMNVAAASFGGKSMSLFAYPLPFILFIATFAAVVGFLTGVFPARRAAALNPLTAISYK
jgi:putative ABC transport system permease protein